MTMSVIEYIYNSSGKLVDLDKETLKEYRKFQNVVPTGRSIPNTIKKLRKSRRWSGLIRGKYFMVEELFKVDGQEYAVITSYI
ncbi:MAG: hypothetical protein HZB67_02775 [Candidatus Aenigmarchaeota archaeon]|nr:hypothetical protein [Candidatus Aenigmarchaeota archaeon]